VSEEPASTPPPENNPAPGSPPAEDAPAGAPQAVFPASAAPDSPPPENNPAPGSPPAGDAPARAPQAVFPASAAPDSAPPPPVSLPPAPPRPTDTRTLLLAILCGLGLLVAGAVGAVLVLAGLASLTSGNILQENAGVLFTFGWISLLIAGLQLPGLVLSIRHLSGRAEVALTIPHRWLVATIAVALVIPLILFGQSLADQNTRLSALLLPPLQLVVVAVPVWWVLEIGRNGLRSGGAGRSWGIASVGMLITMPLIIILEGLTIVIGLILGFSWLSAHPQAFQEIQTIFRALSGSGISSSQASQMLGPIINQPGIIFAFFLYLSVIGPLIEETFKPLAIWLLAGRGLTPTQGFTGGMLCGATFAMLESLSNIYPGLGPEWGSTVAVRVVAALLHVTFSGLVGWGLVLAWQRRKYLQLGGLYLLAVMLHGLWNGVSLLSGLAPLLNAAQYGALEWLGRLANVFMVVLAVIILALLLGVNRYLRTHPEQDTPDEVVNIENQTSLTTETPSHREDL
jgi:fumarate reductase subunit C